LKPITINKNFCEKYGLWKKRKNPERRKVEREREFMWESLLLPGEGGWTSLPQLVLSLSPLGLRCFVSFLSFSQ